MARRFVSALCVTLLACVGREANTSPADGAPDGGNDGPGGDGGPGVSDGSADSGSTPIDGGTTADGSIPISAGDILVLDGAGIVGSTGGPITEWRSAVGTLVAVPTAASTPTVGEYAKKPAERCVVFSGQRPLKIPASTDIDLGSQDFSVTVAVIRGKSHADAPDPKPDHGRVVVARNTLGPGFDYQGFALLSDWQTLDNIDREPRWAARHAYVLNGSGGFEVKGDYRAGTSVREVVVMYRRGDGLYLRDGAVTHGPTNGASAYTISSTTQPLTIGQSDDENDPATRFAGSLCALVIHRGMETDAEITARVAALEAKYPTQ